MEEIKNKQQQNFLNNYTEFSDDTSSIALGYGLEDWGVRVPVGAGNFSLHYRVQTGLLSNGYRGLFPLG
jgi:hypothetical protein